MKINRQDLNAILKIVGIPLIVMILVGFSLFKILNVNQVNLVTNNEATSNTSRTNENEDIQGVNMSFKVNRVVVSGNNTKAKVTINGVNILDLDFNETLFKEEYSNEVFRYGLYNNKPIIIFKGVECDIYGDINGDINSIVSGNINGIVNGSILGNINGSINGNVGGSINGNIRGSINGNVQGSINGSHKY